MSLADIYAQSLFEAAKDESLVDRVRDDMDTLAALIAQEPGFLAYIKSPNFTLSQKQGFLIRVLGASVDNLTHRFLLLLLQRGRAEFLPEMIKHYQAYWEEQAGIMPVQVTVAQALDPQRVTQLTDEIRTALNTQVRVEVDVDPALIGGVKIRYKDNLIDNTLRGRLNRVAKQIDEKTKSTMFGHS